MPTIIGVYTDRETTEQAIDGLTSGGVASDAIGVMWRDRSVAEPGEIKVVSYQDHHSTAASEAGKGVVGGAVGGAATGAGAVLLASAGVALIPGIGALLAAGTAAAAAIGAAAGAVGGGVTGGLFGAVLGAGDNEATKVVETQTRYRDVIERDGFVVTVEASDDETSEIVELMYSSGADDVSVLRDTGLEPATGL
ncbi:MAG: hypothetical protein R3258_10135 [Acidimicrobiia bacterium]|nr:hypothetical protein [Acidimicrobiia bacterium]